MERTVACARPLDQLGSSLFDEPGPSSVPIGMFYLDGPAPVSLVCDDILREILFEDGSLVTEGLVDWDLIGLPIFHSIGKLTAIISSLDWVHTSYEPEVRIDRHVGIGQAGRFGQDMGRIGLV